MIKRIYIALMIFCCILAYGTGFAEVSPEEAAKLKSTLTPLGAERAGNEDGTIPAWEGGYTTVPAGYISGTPRPDPFADEKPLFSITAANMAQYAEKLSDGTKAMLKEYPEYRIDVYPTHRTAAAPDYVYENTLKNATRARTTSNGLKVEGAYGGTPFPIPKDGYEVIWNHLLAWQGERAEFTSQSWSGTSTGKKVFGTENIFYFAYPYYFREGSLETFDGDFWKNMIVTTAPPFKAGETILAIDPVDVYGQGRRAWQYLVGQRRVRRAPSIAYDTPNAVASGVTNYDEAMMYNGAIDRYEWKLLGKKEIYIPYNNNKNMLYPIEEVLLENYPNPDLVRWELHRVWVVDATLANGKRHTVPHRRFYQDEDTWTAVVIDSWDARGDFWRHHHSLPFIAYEVPAINNATCNFLKNLQTGQWSITRLMLNDMQWKKGENRGPGFHTPNNLSSMGVR